MLCGLSEKGRCKQGFIYKNLCLLYNEKKIKSEN